MTGLHIRPELGTAQPRLFFFYNSKLCYKMERPKSVAAQTLAEGQLLNGFQTGK
jgi:hypothetical protein